MQRSDLARLCWAAALLSAAPVAAQDDALPPGHPPVDAAASAGHPAPRARQGAELASASPSERVPAGSVRVSVVDEQGQPVTGALVDVGVLAQAGERARHSARTDAQGVALVEGLATGTAQAYRVNVPFEGATYAATPFQLPTDRGYDVRITRLPVTRDGRFVFLQLYRVIVEVREERLHVIHQAELSNAGTATYVLPAEGIRGALPRRATAFQAERAMTDQRVEQDGGDYVLRGSLPPGTVRLAWTYDLPISSSSMRIPVAVPMPAYALQVFAQAPDGSTLHVSGLPPAQRVAESGQHFWFAQLLRRPSDPPLPAIEITMGGLPSKGPLRWIAIALALLVVGVGVVLGVRRVDPAAALAQARERRRAQLLDEVCALEHDHELGEIGPEYRQRRRDEIVREIALLLHDEEQASRAGVTRTVGAAAEA